MTWLNRKAQSKYLTEIKGLPIAASTLQKLATIGGGPEYVRWGNKALSTPEMLDTWAEQKLSAPRKSTSENTAAIKKNIKS